MTFTVEDGTGLPDANSYASVATADGYFSDRGVSSWTGSDANKAEALVRATDYIDKMFGKRFLDVPLTDTQALAFPRYTLGLPVCVVRACCEYALRALKVTLDPDPVYDASGFKLKLKRTKIGPIETQKEFVGSEPNEPLSYPSADRLLDPVLRPANTVTRQ